jgi:hypothetical protein
MGDCHGKIKELVLRLLRVIRTKAGKRFYREKTRLCVGSEGGGRAITVVPGAKKGPFA